MRLETRNLSLARRLVNVSLSIEGGEMICLVGPNGSGKTSLLHALAGIGSPSGELSLDGIDPRRLSPAVRPSWLTFLPASRDIAWPLLARDLIALGGGTSPVPELELDGLLDRRIDSLSTGERSRILIARAMAPRPRLLLLDEPTANLDPLWQLKLMDLVTRDIRASGRIAIIAIHDLDMAERYADRIMVLNEGRIAAEGLNAPEIAEIFGIIRLGSQWHPVNAQHEGGT